MNLLIRYVAVLLLITYTHTVVQAQDLHFSQFYNAPLNINPALTGVFQEDMRFMANYRSQWSSVPVPFMTVGGAGDMKLSIPQIKEGYFSAGILFNYDEAGDLSLSLSQFSMSTSYTRPVSDNAFLTAGFQFGLGQRGFDEGALLVGNQFNGDQVDPTLPTRETFESSNISFVDLSTGINLSFQNDDADAWGNVGVGVYHLNRPNMSFIGAGEDINRPIRLSMYSFGGWEVTDQVVAILHAMGQLQSEQNEILVGGGARYYIKRGGNDELAVQLTGTARFSSGFDAIIPAVEFYYGPWRLGFSYDVDVSDFSVATNNAGGPELALRYVVTKVKPLKTFKACPIF